MLEDTSHQKCPRLGLTPGSFEFTASDVARYAAYACLNTRERRDAEIRVCENIPDVPDLKVLCMKHEKAIRKL